MATLINATTAAFSATTPEGIIGGLKGLNYGLLFDAKAKAALASNAAVRSCLATSEAGFGTFKLTITITHASFDVTVELVAPTPKGEMLILVNRACLAAVKAAAEKAEVRTLPEGTPVDVTKPDGTVVRGYRLKKAVEVSPACDRCELEGRYFSREVDGFRITYFAGDVR